MQRRKTKVFNAPAAKALSFDATDKAIKRVIAPYVKVVRRSGKEAPSEREYQKFNFYVQNKPSVLLQDLSAFLLDNVDLVTLLHETGDVLKSTTRAYGKYNKSIYI